MRGKHTWAQLKNYPRYGSSPHARETPGDSGRRMPPGRLIPACAGNTVYRPESFIYGDGSSPHARETRPHPDLGCNAERLIPACAGNTEDRDQVLDEVVGSSPHARETHRVPRRIRPFDRLIPACAGNTRLSARNEVGLTAHPRMRGKHCSTWRAPRGSTGSSPHARETLALSGLEGSARRLIPACAGNTADRGGHQPCPSAHPRMRGKHTNFNPLIFKE